MNKKIPKIYVNKIDKNINNNKQVYYSYKDNHEEIVKEEKIDYYQMQRKINDLFRSNDFIYKKKFIIKTQDYEKEYTIISKSYNYLLTINGDKIMIQDIIDIRSV